jgi:predicted transposase YdaD
MDAARAGMAKQFDSTLKQILDDYAPDLIAWLARLYRYPDGPIVTLNPEIDTVQVAADKVFRFPGDTGLLHLEIQSSWDGELPDRMLEYNVFLHRRERVPVRSVAILLRRDANASTVTGQLIRRLVDGSLVLHFEYAVVRVWELSADELLSAGLGLAPLGLLTDDARPRLKDLVRQFAARVEREVPDIQMQSRLLAGSSILLGLRYDKNEIDSLFIGVQKMKESSVYRALIDEGKIEGKIEGQIEGKIEGQRLALVALLEQKFGGIAPELETRIQNTADAAKLQAAIRQVLAIQSPAELVL